MPLGKSMATGTVASATGSAMNIYCGFKPSFIQWINRTDNSFATWSSDMPDASAQKTVDSGAGTTDVSFITTNGITPLFNGFTVGTDANLNTASDLCYWVAFKV